MVKTKLTPAQLGTLRGIVNAVYYGQKILSTADHKTINQFLDEQFQECLTNLKKEIK